MQQHEDDKDWAAAKAILAELANAHQVGSAPMDVGKILLSAGCLR